MAAQVFYYHVPISDYIITLLRFNYFINNYTKFFIQFNARIK